MVRPALLMAGLLAASLPVATAVPAAADCVSKWEGKNVTVNGRVLKFGQGSAGWTIGTETRLADRCLITEIWADAPLAAPGCTAGRRFQVTGRVDYYDGNDILTAFDELAVKARSVQCR